MVGRGAVNVPTTTLADLADATHAVVTYPGLPARTCTTTCLPTSAGRGLNDFVVAPATAVPFTVQRYSSVAPAGQPEGRAVSVAPTLAVPLRATVPVVSDPAATGPTAADCADAATRPSPNPVTRATTRAPACSAVSGSFADVAPETIEPSTNHW